MRDWVVACLVFGFAFVTVFCHSQTPAQDIIINGTANDVWGNGAPPNVMTFWSAPENATGNSVTVNSGGTVSGAVYDGYDDNGSATGNTVTINGGSVSDTAYGGYSYSGSATGNTVTLSGSPKLNGSIIAGGFRSYGTGDVFTGNRLNVWDYSGSAVNSIQNFEYFNFILPAGFKAGDTAFTATAIRLDDGGGVNSTVERVDFMGGGRVQQAGETFTLLSGTITGNITIADKS